MFRKLVAACALAGFYFCNSCASYEGAEECDKIFSQIEDLKNPTLAEYRLIEDFLLNGRRPYLDPLYNSERFKNALPNHSPVYRIKRQLKLVGDNGEMPIFETHNINTSIEDKSRCILIYCSYNDPYPAKAYHLLSELKSSGYSGHVLLRVGGYPNMQDDGIKLCHIPYSWKVAFIKEAQTLGYQSILWLDSSMHPLKDLSQIFTLIEINGYFFLTGGINLDYGYQFKNHIDHAVRSLNLSPEDLSAIPHLVSCLFGVSTTHRKAMKVIDGWFQETKRVDPCVNWFPEELALSVVAWRNKAKPLMHWGLFVCTNENKDHIDSFPFWNFLLDLNR